MKSTPKVIGWICLIIWLCQSPIYGEDIKPVNGLHSITHVSHQVSQNTQIRVVWEPPAETNQSITGYYYRFDAISDHVFTMNNTWPGQAIYISKDAPLQAVSENYEDLNDEPVYFHVAAVDELNEIMGPTQTIGPFRIDSVAPFPATVIAPAITAEQVISLQMGAHHATEMNINSHAYCRGIWEPFQQNRTWQLDDYVGTQIIYVCFRDSAGNMSQTQAAIWFDDVRAELTLEAGWLQTNSSSPIPVTVTFNEKITNFEPADIQVENGQLANFSFQPDIDGDGFASVFTFTVTPLDQGFIKLTVPENAANDLAQNGNIPSETLSIIYDSIPPTVQLTSPFPEYTQIAPIPITITFSEPIYDFVIQDVFTSNAMVIDFQASGGSGGPYSTFTCLIEPSSEGPCTAKIESDKVFDQTSNPNFASNIISFNYDTTPPQATIITSYTETVLSPVPITIAFTEPSRLQSVDSIALTNATISNLSTNGSGQYYTQMYLYLTPQTNDIMEIALDVNTFQDQAKNNNTTALSHSIPYSSNKPSPVIVSDFSGITHRPQIPVQILFSKPVTDFDQNAITLTNAHVDSVTRVSSVLYEFELIFDSPGNTQVLIQQAAALDLSGNTSFASAPFEIFYEPNSRHIISPMDTVRCFEDQQSAPIPVSLSDAEGGSYTVAIETSSDLLSISNNQVTVCVDETCQAPPIHNLTLSAGEAKIIYLTLNPLPNKNGSAEIQIHVSDPLYTISRTFIFSVTPVNDPPVLSIQHMPVVYTEDDPPTVIAPEVSVSDLDSSNFANGTLIVDFVKPHDDNYIEITDQGISPGYIHTSTATIFRGNQSFASFSGGDGKNPLVITFNNDVAKPAVVEQLIHHCITYSNMSQRPVDGTIEARFVLTDGDGGTSLTQTNTLTVVSVNDQPEMILSEKSVSYTENKSPVIITPYARVTDLDALNFKSFELKFEITANATPFDRLTITDTPTIKVKGSYVIYSFNGNDVRVGLWSGGQGSDPLIVTFNSLATNHAVYNVIMAIAYQTVSDMPSTEERLITITLTDPEGGLPIPQTRNIPVISDNDLPKYVGPDETEPKMNEDETLIMNGSRRIFVKDPDISNGNLTMTISLKHGTFTLNDPKDLFIIDEDIDMQIIGKRDDINNAIDGMVIEPEPDYHGPMHLTFTTRDQSETPMVKGITIVVLPVPDEPYISDPGLIQFDEDTAASAWLKLSDVDGGLIHIAVASAYTPLIADDQISLTGVGLSEVNGQYTIAEKSVMNGYTIHVSENSVYSLSLHIQSNPDQFGITEVSILLTDAEGMTFTRIIQVVVKPVNDMPVISAIEDQTIDEDTPTSAIPITVTDLESHPEALTLTYQADKPFKISSVEFEGLGNHRNMIVYPAPNAFGSVGITITVLDHQGGTAATSFKTTIIPQNDLPVVAISKEVYGNEDETVIIPFSLTEYDGDLVTISMISYPEEVIPEEAITILGKNVQIENDTFVIQTTASVPEKLTISAPPLENQFGDVLITMTIMDSTNRIVNVMSLVKVMPVNDPPVVAPIDPQITDEDTDTAPIPIQISDVDNDIETLSVTAQSLLLNLVANEGLQVTGLGETTQLTITPQKDQFGMAPIAVIVTDPDGLTASTFFDLTINAVNDPPTISPIDDYLIAINTEYIPPLLFSISDLETLASDLKLAGEASIPMAFSFTGTGTDRFIELVNPKNFIGIVQIDVTVSDNELSSVASFDLTITAHNDPPEISDIQNQTIPEDNILKNLAFDVTDKQTPSSDLIVEVTASNERLVPQHNISIQGDDITRSLTIQPIRNRTGNTQIIITVTDVSGLKTIKAFTLNVLPENDPPVLSMIPTVACGYRFSLIHDLTGQAYATGYNEFGQLGTGKEGVQVEPAPMLSNVYQLFAGEYHAGAIMTDGSVHMWGSNDYYQLGMTKILESNTPLLLSDLENIQSMALGERHSLALDQSGQIWGWGDNSFYQTGINSPDDIQTPMLITEDSNNNPLNPMIAITAGKWHSLALDHNGTIWAWGRNHKGQLGDGTEDNHHLPMPVLDKYGIVFQDVIAIASGSNFVVALTSDGKVWAWGENKYGQLGLPLDESLRKNPQMIAIETPCQAIAAGEHHALALTVDGRVLAWGSNDYGQLGRNSFDTFSNIPTEIILENQTRVQSIAAGDSHSMAILSNGHVLAWGKNESGQLGDKTTTDRNQPVFMSGNEPDGKFNTFKTLEDHSSEPFSWRINDAETKLANLVVSAHSQNLNMLDQDSFALTPINGRSVLTVTPIPDAEGFAEMCVSLADAEMKSVTACIRLFIENINDPPHIQDIPDLFINENELFGPKSFIISDLESAPNDLTVTAYCLTPEMVPDENINIVDNHLFFIETSKNAHGPVTMVFTVHDPQGLSYTTQFQLMINDRPDIQAPEEINLLEDIPLTFNYTTTDKESESCALTVMFMSNDENLIHPENIAIACEENLYTATIQPQTNQSGICALTLWASDGMADAYELITVTVASINDPPEIQMADQTRTYTENMIEIFPFANANLVDVDSSNFNSGTLSVHWVAGSEAKDRLFVKDSENIIVNEINHIKTVFFGGLPLGTLTGGETGNTDLIIKLIDNASTSVLSELIGQIAFTHDSDNPVPTSRNLSIVLHEPDVPDNIPSSLLLTVVAVNDDPQLMLEDIVVEDFLEIASILETEKLIFDSENMGRLLVTDPDIANDPISLVIQSQKGSIYLITQSVNNLEIVSKEETRIELRGPLNAINEGLNHMVYTANADEQGKEAITFNISDYGQNGVGGGDWQQYELHTTIKSANDPPEIQKLQDQYFDEDTAISIPFKITDIDGDDIVFRLKSYASDIIKPGRISLQSDAIIFTGADHTYTVRVGVDAAAMLTLVCLPEMNQHGEVPFTFTATDPEMYSYVHSFNVHVSPVNDAPQLTGIFDPITYPEDSAPKPFCKGISLIDPDHIQMIQAVVKIQENYQAGDRLSYITTGNIIAEAENQFLTFNGLSDIADYESVLDSLAFDHTTDNPNATSRKILITVNDGINRSEAFSQTIQVQAVNDRPDLWLNNKKVSNLQYLPDILEESQLRFNSDENFLEILDPDIRNGFMTIQLSADKGLLTLNAAATKNLTLLDGQFQDFDIVVFQGKQDDINHALNGMYYWASDDQLGKAHIDIKMNDNGFSGDGHGIDYIQILSFNILAVNDGPEIGSISGQTTLEDTAISIPVSLSDQESDPLTVWLESSNPLVVNPSDCSFIGSDVILVNKDKYVIDTAGTSAQVTAVIMPAEDYSGNAQLTILASDGQLTETHQFSVSVFPENDPPEFIVTPSESFPEGLTIYHLDLNPFVLDIDHSDEVLQWTASSESIPISINKGVLILYPPDDDWYGNVAVEIHVTDPEGLSTNATIHIQVTSVPDSPIISQIPDQVIALGASIPIIPFSVSDAEGGLIQLSAFSYNEEMVPNNNNTLSINNSGLNHQITIDPGKSGDLLLSVVPNNTKGIANVCITAEDSVGQNETRCFNVHIAPYLITTTSGNHGRIEPGGIIPVDQSGAYLPLYFIPDPGYQVDMVIVDGKSVGAVSEYIFFDIRENHDIRVSFRHAEQYVIKSTAGTGGTISPLGDQTVYSGTNFSYTIIPQTGYAIADVRIDRVSIGITNQYTFENINRNYEIAAFFKPVVMPSAQFTANVVSGYAPFTVKMINQSTGDIDSYKWDFGDNSDSGLPSPVHTYASPGQYTVSLTVTGPGGSDTQVKRNWILVERVPVEIDFQADQRSGVAPLIVQFIEDSADTIISRLWNFGDGHTSYRINPSHTYAQPGNYSVSLKVTAAAGTRTIEKQNYIQVLGRKISGRVTGEDIGNLGLANYRITIWQDNTVIAQTTSDIKGNYTANQLPVHDVLFVSACPPEGVNDYFCQYYDREDKLDQAKSVSTSQSDVIGINFVLERAPDNGVSGKIIDQSGIDDTYLVEIWSESIGMGKSMTVDGNNQFAFTGLRKANDYRVYVWSPALQQFFYYTIPSGQTPGQYVPSTSASAWQAATTIPLDEQKLSNINIFIHSDPFIRGRVLVDGKPLANQWVNAWSSLLQAGFGAFTDESGYYEIVGLLASQNTTPVSYVVEVQDSPYPYQVYDNQTAREDATLVYVNTDHVDFNLQGGSSISGTVQDFNGLPLSSVTVSAQSQSTGGRGSAVTDANGNYHIDGLPPASDYIVAVYPVYYPLTYYSNKHTKEEANPVNVSGAGASNINFILQKGAVIRGTLYLETMQTAAPSGIWVNIWSESTQTGGDVPTDATGRFEITGLDAQAADYIISVISPNYVPVFYAENAPNQTVYAWDMASGVQPSSSIDRNLVLISGVELKGRVTFNNLPVADVHIEACAKETQTCRSVLSTDQSTEDNFAIQGLFPGDYTVQFSHSSYVDVSKDVSLSESINRLYVEMVKPNRQISGTIFGLKIGTSGTVTAWSNAMNVAKTIHLNGNDAPRDYQFDSLKPGTDYRVELRSTHYPLIVYANASHWTDAQLIDISNDNASNIDFDLPPPGTAIISGTITLPAMPENSSSIWVDAYSDSLITGKGIEINATQQVIDYEISGLQSAPDYIVSVWSNIYQDIFYNQAEKRSEATLVNTLSSSNINFILSMGGRISGFVTDVDGQPVDGMIIEVQSATNGLFYGSVTDDQGYFSIDGLRNATDYIVTAQNPGESIQYYSASGMTVDPDNATVVVIENNQLTLNLQLIQTGWIQGKVTDESGKAITGIWVSAWSETAKTGSSSHTDSDGQFMITGLPDALDFELTVQSINGTYIDQTRSRIAIYAENILFVMSKGFTFDGRIQDTSGGYVDKATVVLWSSQANIYRSIQTDDYGVFSIQGLKASNDYILRITPKPSSDLAIFQEKGIQLQTSKTRVIVLTDGIRVKGNIQTKDNETGAWTNYTQIITISIYTSDNAFLVSGQSNPDGTYEISNIPKHATMILRVNASGFVPLEQTLSTQLQTNTQDLKLISGATIKGCIKDQSGRQVKNARIMIRSTDAQIAVTGISDNQGCFEIAGLVDTVDDYEISVQADGYVSQSKGGKQAGDSVLFTLNPTSPQAITGQIVDAGGNIPPASIDIVVKLFEKTETGSGGFTDKAQLDENGIFSFTGLSSEQAYHIQLTVRMADGTMIIIWAPNVESREDATDYFAGDEVEMRLNQYWE